MAAARGTSALADLALPYLEDLNREYVTSQFVRLEVLPKPIFFGRPAEVAFYSAFFRRARSVDISNALLDFALEEGSMSGINGMDALHIACAVFAGAHELVTSEKTSSAIHRTKRMRVVSIFPPVL